jgi:hypothetical protein
VTTKRMPVGRCKAYQHRAEPDPVEVAARFSGHCDEVQRAANCLANSLLG